MNLRILVSTVMMASCALTVQASSFIGNNGEDVVKGYEVLHQTSMPLVYAVDEVQEDLKDESPSGIVYPCKGWICWFI